MHPRSLITFIGSFSRKEWLAFWLITAVHVAGAIDFGLAAAALGGGLGLCVSLALIAAFRILDAADRAGTRK